MRAVLCKAYGEPESLMVEELPPPAPGPGQVLVRVEGCGVNFPDLLMIEGKYQRKPEFPFSPGGEVAGTIIGLGAGVQGYHVGDRVLGFVSHGGFAEQIAIDTAHVMRFPPAMDSVTAAAFILTYGTALYALEDRGGLKAGEWLLVLGAAGGVGIAAVEIGKLLGARVIAAASSDEKVAFCRARGADHGINYTTENFRERLREITGGAGIDMVCDPVGGSLSEAALRSTAWNGRFLVVGFAAGEIPRVALNLPLLKGCALVGVAWGAFVQRGGPEVRAHLERLAGLIAAGKLVPQVTKTYALAEAGQAIRDMKERRAIGKLVVVP